MTFKEIKTQADSLRKQKQYEGALPFYEDLWKNYRQDCKEWDGWGYAQCLYHLKDYGKALDICREAYGLKPDFSLIRNLYAWCIYQTEIKQGPAENPDRFLKASEAVLKLCKQEDEFSPYVATVFKTLALFEEPYRPEMVLEWTARLNPDLLRTESRSFEDEKGIQRELASPKEKYFAMRTDALLQTGEYEECLSLCRVGLDSVPAFHFGNDLWLKRRMAKALYNTGKADEAIALLKEILGRKSEWFVKKEIAEVYQTKGDLKEALAYAVDAALDRGEIQMKIKLYELLASLLRSLGREDDARKHVELICRIRLDRGWKLTDDFRAMMDSYGVQAENLDEAKKIHSELRNTWNGIRFGDKPRLEGKVVKLLPNGKAGFVDTVEGRSYYFHINAFQGRKQEVRPGLQVTFFVEKGFDKKKNRPSEVAVNLRRASR